MLDYCVSPNGSGSNRVDYLAEVALPMFF